MNLKTAAFLALIGMILLTVLDAAVFLRDLSGMLQSAVAAMTVLASAIHLFASLTLAIFLFAFFRTRG
jgi:hypothetical protein